MPFNLNPDIDKTQKILGMIAARQEAVGTNLANINTPGYVRQDVDFSQYLGSLNKPLETDLSQKMGSNMPLGESEEKVNLTQELVTMQKNALFYSIAAQKITKTINQMKSVTQLGR